MIGELAATLHDDGPMHTFDHARIRRYYDRHTSGFIALGTGGTEGVIHRAVWGPSVSTSAEAFH